MAVFLLIIAAVSALGCAHARENAELSASFLQMKRKSLADGGVVINEIMASRDFGHSEFVELYNSGSSAIDCSGWKLKEENNEEGTWSSRTIPAKSFVIVGFSEKLNNAGDTVFLIDQNGTEVDQKKWVSSKDDKSLVRLPDGGDWSLTAQTPSPGSSNSGAASAAVMSESVPTAALDESKNIVINELLATPPDGGKEFVELYNTGNTTIDLSGWTLTNAARTSGTFSSSTIAAKAFVVVEFSGTHVLDNAVETVTLSDKGGIVVDAYKYSAATRGKSFARMPDGGYWGAEQTPSAGSTNPAPLGTTTSPAPTTSSS